MTVYQGLSVADSIQYIASVCKKKGWDVNRVAILKMLNEASLEIQDNVELDLSIFVRQTESDVQEYGLPDEINVVHEVYISETGGSYEKRLKPASRAQIKNTDFEDNIDDIIEP